MAWGGEKVGMREGNVGWSCGRRMEMGDAEAREGVENKAGFDGGRSSW